MATATLTWTPNTTDPTFAGVEVYRNGTKIATVLKPTATYVDPSAPDGSDAYDLLAFDASGNKSAHCTPVTVVIDSTPPQVPTGLVVVVS